MANVVQVIIRARDSASGVFRSVNRRLGTLRATAGRITRAFRDVAQAVAGIGIAVGGAIFGLTKLAERGRNVIEVQRAFTRVVGDQRSALETLRSATNGLISDMELMTQFNQAVALGSAESVEQFAELAVTAQSLGRALGIDAAFALQSLNTGIARQSRLFLDNIGLIVSVQEANERYAASLGKTVESLTQAERREAFRTAALEAARDAIERTGGVTITGADAASRFTTQLGNFVDRLGEVVATSPAVERFFNTLSGSLDTLSDKLPGIIDNIAELGRRIVSLVDPVGAQAGEMIAGIRESTLPPESLLAAAEQQVGLLLRRRGELEREIAAATPDAISLIPQLDPLLSGPSLALRQQHEEVETQLQATLRSIQFLREQIRAEVENIDEDITAEPPDLDPVEVSAPFSIDVEPTISNLDRVQDALTDAKEQLADLRFDIVLEEDTAAAEKLQGEIDELTQRIRVLRAERDLLAQETLDVRIGTGFELAQPGAPLAPPGSIPFTDEFLERQRAEQTIGRAAMAGGREALSPFEQRELDRALGVTGRTQEAFKALVDDLAGGAGQFDQVASFFISSMGAMAQAAIQGGEITAQAIINMIGNILQSVVPGPFGAVIGAVTGIAGSLFGRDDPVPVRVTEFEPEAEEQLDPRREGPDRVQIFLNGNLITDERVALAQIRRAERRDAVVRVPDRKSVV